MVNLLNPIENILLVGFVFGLRHAIESDHIAAIFSLTDQTRGFKAAAKMGVVWGIGHTLVLTVVGGAVLLMGSVMPVDIAVVLEWIAGLMLVLFGLDVVRRAITSKLAFSAHAYQDSDYCFHTRHNQQHNEFPLRAFVVGLIHGLAGSAALVLLTLNTAQTKWVGFSYILIFGLGSIIGMGVLSLLIALPLNKVKNIGQIYQLACICGGLFTIMVGSLLLNENTGSILAML